jgi:hypothetical protein
MSGLESNLPVVWNEIMQWSVKELQGKSLQKSIRKLYLAAVYHLWLQRNALLPARTPKTEEQLLARIRWKVKTRLIAKFHSKCS